MPHSPIYQSKKWKEVREKYLALNPWCQICARIGIKARAVEVDHIRTVESGGALFNFLNLSGKCRLHHSQKTMSLDMARGGRDKLVTTGPDGLPCYVEVSNRAKKP